MLELKNEYLMSHFTEIYIYCACVYPIQWTVLLEEKKSDDIKRFIFTSQACSRHSLRGINAHVTLKMFPPFVGKYDTHVTRQIFLDVFPDDSNCHEKGKRGWFRYQPPFLFSNKGGSPQMFPLISALRVFASFSIGFPPLRDVTGYWCPNPTLIDLVFIAISSRRWNRHGF